MKIYIIGSNGSGKTTLAKSLSHELNIPYYELDRLLYINNYSSEKREEEEVLGLFNDLLASDDWIIEDLGRDIFKYGLVVADLIIFLDISLENRLKRIANRYENQKNGLLETSYIIDDDLQERIYKSTKDFEQRKEMFVNSLQQFSDKLLVLNDNKIDINEIKKRI